MLLEYLAAASRIREVRGSAEGERGRQPPLPFTYLLGRVGEITKSEPSLPLVKMRQSKIGAFGKEMVNKRGRLVEAKIYVSGVGPRKTPATN